jgi:hypothetical protein
VRVEELGQMKKKINDLIGNRTRDLPACSIVPQPITLLRIKTKLTCEIHLYSQQKIYAHCREPKALVCEQFLSIGHRLPSRHTEWMPETERSRGRNRSARHKLNDERNIETASMKE